MTIELTPPPTIRTPTPTAVASVAAVVGVSTNTLLSNREAIVQRLAGDRRRQKAVLNAVIVDTEPYWWDKYSDRVLEAITSKILAEFLVDCTLAAEVTYGA